MGWFVGVSTPRGVGGSEGLAGGRGGSFALLRRGEVYEVGDLGWYGDVVRG